MNINLTLFGQMIAFACFVWFCMRYVWPPITQVLKKRQMKIAEGLNKAEQAEYMLDQSKKESKNMLLASKKEANNIIANTQKISQSILDEARQNAKKEHTRILQAGHEQVEKLRQKALDELKEQMGGLVFSGVEAIVKREVDQKVHEAVLSQLKKRLN